MFSFSKCGEFKNVKKEKTVSDWSKILRQFLT